MTSAAGFRLTVLNPGGRDPRQDFPEGAGEAGSLHAPVNFHAFAACTNGTFHRETAAAIAEKTPVLVLLRGDFKEAVRAVAELKKADRTVAVSLKETGLHQIAQQLARTDRLERFAMILREAHGCLATTSEAATLFRTLAPEATRVAFIPTPYPVDDPRWDFDRRRTERKGIFIGTREWDVPSRNHLGSLLLARDLVFGTDEPVTVYDFAGRSGASLLGAIGFPPDALKIMTRRLRYPDYLRSIAHHKLVLQLDGSCVPGQVAGDALLCRTPCVGGNGAIERIAFTETNGFGRTAEEIHAAAQRVLKEPTYAASVISNAMKNANAELSFEAGARALREFFEKIAR